MIRSFRHRGLKRLYERNDRSRVRADQPTVSRLLSRTSTTPVDHRTSTCPDTGFIPLKGDLKPFWSTSVSGNWRIVFRFDEGDVYDVDLVDYH